MSTRLLGCFPGVASLAAQQYYGHSCNHFWPIIVHAFDVFCACCACLVRKVSYSFKCAQRCPWLLDHGVGLWDVYASCERQGSPANASWSLERKKAAWAAALGPVLAV